MPMPIHCVECDKPMMYRNLPICDNCIDTMVEHELKTAEPTTADKYNESFIKELEDV